MTDTQPSVVIRELTWIKSHLITLLVAAGLVFSGIYAIEYLIEKHDKAKDALYQQILAAQSAQTKALTDKLNQDERNWTAQNAALQQTIGTLATTIAKRDSAAKQQQQIDSTLSAEAAAQRLGLQTKAGDDEVTSQGNTVILALPVARQIAGSLDELPVVKADLSDTLNELTAQTTISSNLQANLTEQKQLTTALTTQLGTQVKACQAQVAEVKAKARKNYLKAFLGGVVAGLALHFIG